LFVVVVAVNVNGYLLSTICIIKHVMKPRSHNTN